MAPSVQAAKRQRSDAAAAASLITLKAPGAIKRKTTHPHLALATFADVAESLSLPEPKRQRRGEASETRIPAPVVSSAAMADPKDPSHYSSPSPRAVARLDTVMSEAQSVSSAYGGSRKRRRPRRTTTRKRRQKHKRPRRTTTRKRRQKHRRPRRTTRKHR